jgi:hypothetical protein
MTDEQRVADLTELLTRLGATDPAAWARSEVEEDIPQVARYLFGDPLYRRRVRRRPRHRDHPRFLRAHRVGHRHLLTPPCTIS